MTKSKRLIRELINATRDEAFAGSLAPDERPIVRKRFRDARKKLVEHIEDLIDSDASAVKKMEKRIKYRGLYSG